MDEITENRGKHNLNVSERILEMKYLVEMTMPIIKRKYLYLISYEFANI